jgi:class 3 adenylate cyclase
VDRSGVGGGGLNTTALVCSSCGAPSSPTAKFCSECGTPLNKATQAAEYKQVTVLFADVVHSMDVAATVGPERLREIMTELVNRAAVVVQRYGGTVAQFTGDGIMAVFGAPTALEDHAVRACLAASGIQEEAKRLAGEVKDRDGVDLGLRVGLNSGQVIAGEIGSGPFGYTAVGEQVGMAQRMESVAAPGGVMLSASTARLVDGTAVVGAAELVQIKGANEPVTAYRLLGMGEQHRAVGRAESNLVGRRWEMSAVEGLLDRAVDGHGAVVGVVGPPGIGKSRLVRELSAMASSCGVEVFSTFCESHATDIAFRVVARLLRAAAGVMGLDEEDARARVRAQVPDADPEDVVLLYDLLGIADPEVKLPRIDPDARRRRLTALVNAASLARSAPALYVIEDAHWIDEVSESMLADFFTVIPHTPSMVVITYRPEYEGALTRMHGAQTIALAPLSDSESSALVATLLGPDSSVGELGEAIVARTAGNPFFAQEMVRDLAERGVLRGRSGGYVCHTDVAEVRVPPTLQAAIAARIDRLDGKAKSALSAAAVIGLRFDTELLASLGVEPVVDELVRAELIDQVRFTPLAEYAFRHPLIRTVAYESQLKSDRAQLHRRAATMIDHQDQNAALIAEHLEAAGDLRVAYGWHMRAGGWSTRRDIAAARASWERARRIADVLPDDDQDRTAMRIAPRTKLCGSAWRGVLPNVADRFEELRELCTSVGDNASLAIGMTALAIEHMFCGRMREASRLASEQMALLETIDDPTSIMGAATVPISLRYETGHVAEILPWLQTVIEWAEGDSAKRSPTIPRSPLIALAYRRVAVRVAAGPARQVSHGGA